MGDSLIVLQTSSLVTGTKALKTGDATLGTPLGGPEAETASLILLILLEKKAAKVSVGLFVSCEKAK